MHLGIWVQKYIKMYIFCIIWHCKYLNKYLQGYVWSNDNYQLLGYNCFPISGINLIFQFKENSWLWNKQIQECQMNSNACRKKERIILITSKFNC